MQEKLIHSDLCWHCPVSYDSIGNRLTSSDNFGTATYAANCLNQYTAVNRTIEQLVLRSFSEGGSNNLTCDADGNLTQDGRFTYAYDDENRLVSVTSLNPQFGSRSIKNVYDHQSRRVKKVVKCFDGTSWNAVETHAFVWDGWNIIFEQITFADNTTRTIEYFWGNDVSGSEQGAGGVGGLLATRIDGVFYVPVYGGNGNIMMYVGGNGWIAAQYDYDPYGNSLQATGPLASQFVFGFSTKYHDREVGLVAYQFRTYNPTYGRWLNRDPIEEAGGENLYEFCHDNPIVFGDVNGLFLKPMIIGPRLFTPQIAAAHDPKKLADGTFRSSLDYFLWFGPSRTFHYHYPQHSATLRLLEHPTVAAVWRRFVGLDHCLKEPEYGNVNYNRLSDSVLSFNFIRDVSTWFGTIPEDEWFFDYANLRRFLICSSAVLGFGSTENYNAHVRANIVADDYGYEVLGRFAGDYTISTDSRKCTKRLSMTVKNVWSLQSLTRIPVRDTSIVDVRSWFNNIWQPVYQEYHYEVERSLERGH